MRPRSRPIRDGEELTVGKKAGGCREGKGSLSGCSAIEEEVFSRLCKGKRFLLEFVRLTV